MGSTTAQAQVDKKPYRNQTAGWLGVVKLDHLGAQVGFSIEPYGTVYLSDEEAILTARAPRDPKDNPFVEQNFMFVDNSTGQQVEQPMRPLVLITDDREVPSEERYVPGAPVTDESVAAAARDAEAALSEGAVAGREVPTSPSEPTLVPSSTAAVPPSHATRTGYPDPSVAEPPEEDHPSWTENPDRTATPQPGSLVGSNEPVPGPTDEDVAKTGSPTAAQPVPQPPLRATSSVAPAEEEHAAHLASGEETGAADLPSGQAPEGEYAAHEEVGSPDAPKQSGK